MSICMTDRNHIFKSYLCPNCHHILLSKTGAKSHECFVFTKEKKLESENFRHRLAIHYFLRFIATTNTPFKSAENSFLEKAFKQLDSEFELPKRDKLRSEMIDLSNQITEKLKSDVKYKKVSIL